MINFPIINEEPLEKDFLTGKPVGAFKAAGMGVVKAGVDVGGFITMAGAGVEGLLATGYGAIGFEEAADDLKKRQENFYKFYEDYVKPAREYLTPDPALTSWAGKVLHGVGSVVPLLLTGHAAAPLLIGSATMNTGAELAEQGVDAKTATALAIGSGAITAAMIKIPASGKNFLQTLGLAASNPAIGAAQRKGMKDLLQAEGYEEAAKAYDPLDPTAMAIDTVMGIFFGGMAHYGRARAKMPIEVEDAIDTAASFQKKIKDTPFEQNPKTNRVNLAAKEKAMQDLAENKPVDVSEQIAELHSTEEVLSGKKQPWQMTKEEALQNASVNRYGRTEIGGVEPDYTVGMMQRQAEFSPEAWIEDGHKRIIKKALQEGKPVPEEVLKDYPEIQELLQKMGPLKPSMPFKKTESPETIAARATATDAINELHDTVDEVARLNGMEPEVVDIEQGSPEWLELRMGKRMASETPAVLGLSPFTKAEDLWAYKTGRKQFKETEAMSVGKLNEEPARNLINQKYETEFKPSVVMKGEFGASLDGISPDGKTILEIKVPYKGKDSQLWKEVQDGKIPEHYRAQLQHQLMISGADAAWFTVYDRKSKGLIMLIEKPDRAMQKKITDAWEKFWPHIAEDRPLVSAKPAEEAASASELKPYITLKRPVKSNTVVEWIEKQGKINYNKEHFKGELDILAEKDPRFKTLLNKKDKGLTLDELALRAKEEGFIKEDDPIELLDAIEKRKMRISDEEDFLVKEMEYNKPILNDPIEKMVESRLKEEGDLPATFKGKNEATGRVEYDSARERIDEAKNEYHKTKNLEDVYNRIGNCLRGGG